MELDIRPNEGVGPLHLGMTREEAQAAIGSPREALRTCEESGLGRDLYAERGIFVEYDRAERCVAFELTGPADPVLRGCHVLRIPAAEPQSWLQTLTADVEEAGGGLQSLALGVAFYAPALHDEDEPDEPAETVIVFEHGYYDRDYQAT